MNISVVMIDGEFRENTFSAEYLSKQDFPSDQYEIIWVEFYSKVPDSVRKNSKVRVITLNNPSETIYHSSFCFNKGIAEAKGELIIIPDADQIMAPDFLSLLWETHSTNDKLAVYSYRYDEIKQGELSSHEFSELEKKCKLKNPKNYGGCLSVRKKWLLAINGYEQHKILESGFHANGLDIYTRFKNYGLAIMWAPHIKMYHPWHPFTLNPADEYKIQNQFIDWRARNLQYMAIKGIDASLNEKNFNESAFIKKPEVRKEAAPKKSILQRILNKF